MKYVADERGSIALIASIVLLVLLLVGAVSFGAWAYMGRQDYKDNVDQKVAAAVKVNTKEVQASDAVAYAEEAKKPLKTYTGPSEFGSLQVQYPKTWSGYVVVNSGGAAVSGYFAPDVVPSVQAQTSIFALRIEVVKQAYSAVLKNYASLQTQGKVTVQPYAFPKVPGVVGSRIDGQITQKEKGTVILMPLRDKTIKIWTESADYKNDFETNILPNLTFSP